MVNVLRKNWVHAIFILVVAFFAFFVNNHIVYEDIMESRNLVTAREMVEFGNWLVPTMNGELRIEKPPLPTWIAAAIEKISPDNIAVQRGAAGVMATLMLLFLYFLMLSLTGNSLSALMAALILGTSFNTIMMGRVATWDIYCHSFMLGAIFFLQRALAAFRTRWWDFVLAGLFMGLSFLSKGPVSFYALLLPFLICYLILYRPSFKRKWWPLILMIVVFLIISSWWPFYLYLNNSDNTMEIVAKESSAWIEKNVRPWYYYWLFFAESGIWSIFLLTGLLGYRWLMRKMPNRQEYQLVVGWTVMTLVLLSLFPEKKTRYLLPLLIPAAMVIAHYIHYIYVTARSGSLTIGGKTIFRFNAFIPGIIALAVPVGLYLLFYSKGVMGATALIITSLLFLAVAVSIFVGGIKLKIMKVFTGIVIMMMIVESLLIPYVATMFNNPEMSSISAVNEIEELKGIPFYYPSDEELRIELVYEARRSILPVDIQHGKLPEVSTFVLVSAHPARLYFNEEETEHLEMRQIALYDNNRRLKSSRRNDPIFVRYVTLITLQ